MINRLILTVHPVGLWLVLFAAGAALGHSAAAADSGEVSFASLLEEMTNRNRIAEWPDPAYRCVQFSSYDRRSKSPEDAEGWFANDDCGHFLRIQERDGRREGVMMDATGPGAVVRIWSANPAGTLRIYIDGADEPALAHDMAALLSGNGPVPEPLAGARARGFNLYLPIPFAKRCVITTDQPDGLYYHVNARLYSPRTQMQSFASKTLQDDRDALLGAIAALRESDQHIFHDSRSRITLQPGETKLIYSYAQQGVISLLRFGIDPTQAEWLRQCVVSIRCDGVRTVHVPLPDLFAWSPGAINFDTWPVSVRDGVELSARWPMPFEDRVEVTLANRSDQPIQLMWQIGVNEYAWTDRSMHFHAVWRHEGPMSTRPRRDWNYATIQGRGLWVGDSLIVTNPIATWWGEGDEKVYVDGEAFPSHFGTGTEDYYGYAWGSGERFAAPFHAQTRCDGPGSFGHTIVARHRLLDVIPFEKSLKFDMEIWHWAECEVEYAATSYFYLHPDSAGSHNVELVEDPPLLRSMEFRPFRRAGAIEAEDLEIAAQSEGVEISVQTLGDGAPESWSGMKQLWCRASQPGESAELRVPVESPGKREVIVWLTRSWDYGIVQLSINGEKAGPPVDTFHIENPNAIGVPQPHSLGTFHLPTEGFTLRMEVVGTNPNSRRPHYYWGLDCIELK